MSGNNRQSFAGRYPATVKRYDKEKRQCAIEVKSLTEGADGDLMAEIEYPIGDNSRKTDIEILTGDTVWIEFIAGDPRYPIITGWRNPNAGNEIDLRFWHQKNITIHADELLILKGGRVRIQSDDVVIEGTSFKHNDKNVGDTHTHSGIASGPSSTGSPN